MSVPRPLLHAMSATKGSIDDKHRVPPHFPRDRRLLLPRPRRHRLRFGRRRVGERQDAHHRQLRATEECQNRPEVLRRGRRLLRAAEPGHRRRHPRRLPLRGPQDVRRQTRRRSDGGRVLHVLHRRPACCGHQPGRGPHAVPQGDEELRHAPEAVARHLHGEREGIRHTAYRIQHGADLQPRPVQAGRPRPRPAPHDLGRGPRRRQEDRRPRQRHRRVRRLQRPEPGRLALHRRAVLPGRRRRQRRRQEGDRRHPRGPRRPAEPARHAVDRQLHGQQTAPRHQRRTADDGRRQARHVPGRTRQHPDPRQGEGRQLRRHRHRPHARRPGHPDRRGRLHVQQARLARPDPRRPQVA
ncbi:hypothetical protein SGPA1_40277 [Streptomyces misionensis JCM 4497]